MERKSQSTLSRRSLLVRGSAVAATAAVIPTVIPVAMAQDTSRRPRFQRIPIQYIAVLADPKASAGDNAQEWGLWPLDPGPRGVTLANYEGLRANNDVAPSQWKFNNSDWWLEEHGLIMEAPQFPMPAGQYMVTGDREKEAMLTIYPRDADGKQHWALGDDANIYDVTHLRCRSARYTPANGEGSCTPAQASIDDFPVSPGADMPPVPGCNKQDYAVLIIYAIAEDQA